MTITKRELERLIAELPLSDSELVQLACLMHISTSHIRKMSDKHQTDLSHLIDLAERCALTYSASQGIDTDQLLNALHGIRRAQSTFEYLDSLPD